MIKLTIFFDDPFWVGVFERFEEDKLEICRVVFGQEPKDNEIYEFILKNFYKLQFSNSISVDVKAETKVNPKRMQRKVRRALQEKGIGTKAQQALKLDCETRKIERKMFSKEKREREEEIKFQKKQEKKKQKKKGH